MFVAKTPQPLCKWYTKLFQVIYNLYPNINPCIWHYGEFSHCFASEKGVRQGEILSPILFSLFLNDMQTYIEQNSGTGIELRNLPDNFVA